MTGKDNTTPEDNQEQQSQEQRKSSAGKDYFENIGGDVHTRQEHHVHHHYPPAPSSPITEERQKRIGQIGKAKQRIWYAINRAGDWEDARYWLKRERDCLIDNAINEVSTAQECFVDGLTSEENRHNIMAHFDWILCDLKKRDPQWIPLKQFVQDIKPRPRLYGAYSEVFASIYIQIQRKMEQSPQNLSSGAGNSLLWFLSQIIKHYSQFL